MDAEGLAKSQLDLLYDRGSAGRCTATDLERLCEIVGVSVRNCALSELRFEGKTLVGPDGPEIALSQAQYFRSRFTKAHELGHIAVMTAEDKGLRRLDAKGGPQLETFCNKFAASLLMPVDAFSPIAKLQDELTTRLLVKISYSFKVSASAAAIRLNALGRNVKFLRFSPMPDRENVYWLSQSVGVSAAFERWIRIEGLCAGQIGQVGRDDSPVRLQLAVGASGESMPIDVTPVRMKEHLYVVVDQRAKHDDQLERIEAAVNSFSRTRRLEGRRRRSKRLPGLDRR